MLYSHAYDIPIFLIVNHRNIVCIVLYLIDTQCQIGIETEYIGRPVGNSELHSPPPAASDIGLDGVARVADAAVLKQHIPILHQIEIGGSGHFLPGICVAQLKVNHALRFQRYAL